MLIAIYISLVTRCSLWIPMLPSSILNLNMLNKIPLPLLKISSNVSYVNYIYYCISFFVHQPLWYVLWFLLYEHPPHSLIDGYLYKNTLCTGISLHIYIYICTCKQIHKTVAQWSAMPLISQLPRDLQTWFVEHSI